MKKQHKAAHTAKPKKKKSQSRNIIDAMADAPFPPPDDANPDDGYDDPYSQLPDSSFPNLLAGWVRGSGATYETVDTGIRDDDDGLTPQQRRMRYLSTCPPDQLDFSARGPIDDVTRRARSNDGLPGCVATMTRTQPRDTTSGVYVPTIETFNRKVAAITTGQPDDNAATLLLQSQPWRKACALTPDKKTPPVPTFGPTMLPQSHDPVDALDNPREPEKRPTHWEPGMSQSDILLGIAHDLANCTSALSARLTIALGHAPDTESINNLRALIRSANTLQRMIHTEEDRRAERAAAAEPRKRKPGPGRPRKLRLPEDAPAVTLRVELIEKRKKFGKRKTTVLTPEESKPEVVKNTETQFSPEPLPTPEDSTPEVVKNKTSEIPHPNETEPGRAGTPARSV